MNIFFLVRSSSFDLRIHSPSNSQSDDGIVLNLYEDEIIQVENIAPQRKKNWIGQKLIRRKIRTGPPDEKKSWTLALWKVRDKPGDFGRFFVWDSWLLNIWTKRKSIQNKTQNNKKNKNA